MSDLQDWNHWLDELLDKGVALSCAETDVVEALETRRLHGPLALTDVESIRLHLIYRRRVPL